MTDTEINRLDESNSERRSCKLGTVSTSVLIYEGDLPLKKGDVIRYAERKNASPKRGRVLADPDDRHLFIGLDPTAPLLEDQGDCSD